MKPITLHGHAGPNPWKVALILEEPSIPYEMKIWATEDQKKQPFTTTLNPNGLTPVIEDANTGAKIWESGAIVEYLLETYDKGHLISFPSSSIQDRAGLLQYSFLQATSQGPNLSLALYFTRNPNPEARKRFVDESFRVLNVLETELGGNRPDGKRKEWLVGGKCTAADLVFVPYLAGIDYILGDDKPDLQKDYPNVATWMQMMKNRASVSKVLRERASVLATALALMQNAGKN